MKYLNCNFFCPFLLRVGYLYQKLLFEYYLWESSGTKFISTYTELQVYKNLKNNIGARDCYAYYIGYNLRTNMRNSVYVELFRSAIWNIENFFHNQGEFNNFCCSETLYRTKHRETAPFHWLRYYVFNCSLIMLCFITWKKWA